MENLTNINVIKDIFERHGFSFSKTLGQNFLINPSICPKIAEMGNAAEGWGVLEIGTGVGVLTHELAKRADKVVAVEIDERLIPILKETLEEHDNVTVINEDVMKADLAAIIEGYYRHLPIESITVMVQKEAGKRLCAEMGSRDTGAVTAAVRYYAEPKLLFNVSRGSFMPAPNVDSCVIRLDVNKKPAVEVSDEAFYFKIVRGAFSQRRKNLCNSLSSAMGIPKGTVTEAVKAAGVSENARPEQLQLKELAAVAEELKKIV